MDRRIFVSQLARTTALAGLNGSLGLALTACGDKSAKPIPIDHDLDVLALELVHLVDPHFAFYAQQRSVDTFYTTLQEKGVVADTGEFFEQGVAAIAPVDPMVEYRGFYYTETELQLYGLAYLLSLG